ncbi:hypothetical protein LTS10_007429 [Elasticomyces elasticus]|nr:hypothetical protein LTS10_007429 [Elasticomyces elasticus]
MNELCAGWDGKMTVQEDCPRKMFSEHLRTGILLRAHIAAKRYQSELQIAERVPEEEPDNGYRTQSAGADYACSNGARPLSARTSPIKQHALRASPPRYMIPGTSRGQSALIPPWSCARGCRVSREAELTVSDSEALDRYCWKY